MGRWLGLGSLSDAGGLWDIELISGYLVHGLGEA